MPKSSNSLSQESRIHDAKNSNAAAQSSSDHVRDEIFTSKNAIYAAGSMAAVGLAIRFAPVATGEAVAKVALDSAESLGSNLLKPAGRSIMSLAHASKRVIAQEGERVYLSSFSSVKPTGRVEGLLSGLEEKALIRAANTPKDIGVSQDSWLARIYEKSRSAVVSLEKEGGKHAGSGFIVDADKKLVATAHHVVAGLEDVAHNVRLHSGESVSARVVGFDQSADVAVLKITGNPSVNLQALKLGEPLELQSKRAAAMGFPQFGDGRAVISPGAFKSAAYTEQSRLHFAMKTYFGNSGGPIVGNDGAAISLVKTGIEAGEYSAPDTIGANIEHLRSLLGVVRDREVAQGPLSIDSEILSSGRAMFSANDIFALRDNPALAAKLKSDLAVRIL
jgi:S1-C subfamily serine protease